MTLPLITTVTLINGGIALVMAGFLHQRNRDQIKTSSEIRRMIIFFYLMSGVWLSFSLAHIMSLLSPGQAVFFLLAESSLYFFAWATVQATTTALHKEKIGRTLTALVVAAYAIFLVIRLLNLAPYEQVNSGLYTFWEPPQPFWLNVLTGAVSGFAVTWFGLTFMWLGWRARTNMIVWRRSLALGLGMLTSLVAVAIYFFNNPPSLTTAAVACVVGAAGIIVMFVGLYPSQSPSPQTTLPPNQPH